jgi:hypothetical protein
MLDGCLFYSCCTYSPLFLCREIKDDCIIDEKSITAMFKFTISLINMYGTTSDSTKNHLAKHISSMLDVGNNLKHEASMHIQ